jgi:CheY-like chemotaxis protein
MAPRILIIEDNPDCRAVLACYLQHLGYEILQAEDSRKAIGKAIAEQPDLILTDFRLPDMDAVEAAIILKRDPSAARIPIIVLTGVVDAQCKRQALEAGITRYLLKPIPLRELANEIKLLIDPLTKPCSI